MVGFGGKPGTAQLIGQAFRILPGARVHHGGTVAVLLQKLNQPSGFILLLQRFHLADDIRAVRRGAENALLLHAEKGGPGRDRPVL